ncbi:MAG TPA: ACP phosphodiesterase [Ferruginibacter sp.]|nr:ACP phosphodiesterase [Ferruginibacter sp.]
MMNFLAHAYLSFDDPSILLGNLISDFVKGKKQYDYPLPVQQGIRLHRLIDAFTDAHPATRRVRSFFQPDYRLYSGAFADVVYDYFLANDTSIFPNEPLLQQFVSRVYASLQQQTEHFPASFHGLFDSMQEHNWLFHYRFEWGIQRSFAGIAQRARYIDDASRAFELFQKHQTKLEEQYRIFFPLLKYYAHTEWHRFLQQR